MTSHTVEYLNKSKTMCKVDGLLFFKSRRRLKTEEELSAARDKRRAYMKSRRKRIAESLKQLQELKAIKTNMCEESVSPPTC